MKKHTLLSTVRISKEQSYKEMRIVLVGIERERTDKFNNLESIEVTEEEITAIGSHRWLIKEN